jgi:hypothetical protein
LELQDEGRRGVLKSKSGSAVTLEIGRQLLTAGLWFNPSRVHVRIVVVEVQLGQIFLCASFLLSLLNSFVNGTIQRYQFTSSVNNT